MCPPIVVALAISLAAVARAVLAQDRLIPLDSAAVAALAPLRPRIDRADELRLRGPAGVTVILAPRLVPSGLGYGSRVGPDPVLDGRDFVLQARGPATETGAMIGVILLGFGGALIGSAFSEMACFEVLSGCDAPRLEGALIVGVVGAAAGGLVGAVIGSRFRTWRTIYRHALFVQDYRYPER